MVPNGWSQKTLEDLSIVERGKFSARPRNDPRYFGGEMPFVQTGDVTGSKTYLNSFTQTLNQDGIGVSKVFPKGTILITIAANIGDTAITSFDVACPDSVVAIQPYSTKADTYWLKNVLDTKKEDLDSQSTQNAQKNINLQVLKPLVILTPPLSEQKKIAKILSTWDKAINTTEQLLANSQQQKKALMQQLLTGKKRLLDKSGIKFSGEWKFKKINQIATRVQRKSDGNEHPILTISSLSGFVRQDERYSRYMAGESVKNYILLERSEFAYNKGNSKTYEFGCVFDLDGYETGLVPHVYVCFKLKADLSHRYFKYLFEADYLKPQLGALVNTGVRNNGLLNIKPDAFMSTQVPVPCIEEQERIADILHASSEQISQLQKKLDCLKMEKQALMQQLLTGKRRVKVEAAA